MKVCSIGLQWFKSFESQLKTCWMATSEITYNWTVIITHILLLCIDYRRKYQFLMFHNATIGVYGSRRIHFQRFRWTDFCHTGRLSHWKTISKVVQYQNLHFMQYSIRLFAINRCHSISKGLNNSQATATCIQRNKLA